MSAKKVKVIAKRKIVIEPTLGKSTQQQQQPGSAVPVAAERKKILHTRSQQADGGFLINYYYIRSANGTLIPEDIRSATHYERVFYDSGGNILGSILGELGGKIFW